MRKWIAVVAPVLLTLACTRPEVEAFRRNPTPIVVTFQVPEDIPDAAKVSKEYAAALRARLATRVTVVPEGQAPPPAYADLKVTISEVRRHGDPSPGAVGVATGVAVGTLSALAGNRDAVFDGFFWGLWAGSHAAAVQEQERDRLGYRPQRVNAVVSLVQTGMQEPLWEFMVRSNEVIDAMDTLSGSERKDEGRIREEEARAFARVVVEQLQDYFHWMARSQPSYYRPEGWKPPENQEEPQNVKKAPEASNPPEESKPMDSSDAPTSPQ